MSFLIFLTSLTISKEYGISRASYFPDKFRSAWSDEREIILFPGYEVKIVIAVERKEKVRSFDYRCQLPVKSDRPSPATFQDGVKGRGFPMYEPCK